MTTTFITRETARDALVTLFTATGKWNDVYGYVPKTFSNVGSVLTIRSGGTQQDMLGLDVNPVKYKFIAKSYVLIDDGREWHADDTEDRIDELDRVFRQTIRDNAGAGTGGRDYLSFEEAPSVTTYVIIDGVEYRAEEWTFYAHYSCGA